MSVYGSQRALHSLSRRSSSRSDVALGQYSPGGNGYAQDYVENYSHAFSTGSMSGAQRYARSSQSLENIGQNIIQDILQLESSPHVAVVLQRASILQNQCQEFFQKAEFVLQTDTDRARAAAEAEHCMISARDIIEQLKSLAVDLRNMGQPNESVLIIVDECTEQLRALYMALGGSVQRKSRGSRGSIGWDEADRSFQDAIAWIAQQKLLIEMTSWGDEPSAIDQQIMNHNKFRSSIQRSVEVERAQEELRQRGDKASLHLLEQEWDSLQKLSFEHGARLLELQNIIEEITQEIMWVNDREEEELMFDWSDKNIDVYITKKQESYSKLMSDLEVKEKHLNKLKMKVDSLLANNHPASDKIEAYMETLQTQWSWLLQITKCIHVHLKMNSAYSQFFKEANETHNNLQQQHEVIRKKFACDKTTPLTSLQELLKALEKEQKHLIEYKQQVQQLISKSKNIVRLRPRNPEEKYNTTIKVQALCDFRQDQRMICKDDLGILKDSSERSKWLITGPGGLDMEVPSVCLIVPPPNPQCISLASKNEQYYDALQCVWNQLFINIKSLISWQYCLHDISRINSLTIAMLAQMSPEDYRVLIKSLESHYQEYKRNCVGSEMFAEEDLKTIENQYTGAQKHYDQLITQLPVYSGQRLLVVDSSAKPSSSSDRPDTKASSGGNLMSELQALQLNLEVTETALSTHQHVPVGQGAPAQYTNLITGTQAVQNDVESLRGVFLRLQEQVLKDVEDMKDTDKVQFLHSQLSLVSKRLDRLGSHSAAYVLRLKALKSLLQNLLQAEDVVKVYEARLTERETTSLDPADIQDYRSALGVMRSELDQKEGVLRCVEEELMKARQCNEQIDQNLHRCDVDLCLYSDHVKQLSDRWKRIQTQINSRSGDLDTYLQQLKIYLKSSSALDAWINDTKSRVDAQMTARTDDITVFKRLLNQQKTLNSEITGKRETVEALQRAGDTCVSTIKDYELGLASYCAGLETLLNIPIKKTMLQSPSTVIIQEVSSLHSRYLELLTRSSDYCKFLGDSLKNLEELKMRNTKIDLLEEDLRLLQAHLEDHDAKNISLREALSQYQLKLNRSQEDLLSLEEVKRSHALQCSTAQANLSSSQSRLYELQEELRRLGLLLEEEKRSRKIMEERYSSQQAEHEEAMRKRLKELEGANWAKIELEQTVSDRIREMEHMRRQLEEESGNLKQAQVELAKVRQQYGTEMSELKQTYESQILVTQTNIQKLSHQWKDDSMSMQLEHDRVDGERKKLLEEVRRLQLNLSEEQAQRRHAEAMLQQQITASTEEARRRSELEAQVQQLLRQQSAEESRWKDDQAHATKSLQEKTSQISSLTQSLNEEVHKRRALEADNDHLQKELADLHAKHTSCNQELIKLRSSHQELSILRVEVTAQGNERSRAEQNIAHLQARVQELQEELKQMDGQMNQQIKVAQEEAAKRRKTEAQLEKTNQAMREYISTITTLQKSQDEASTEAKKLEEDRNKLQMTLDRSVKECSTSAQHQSTLEAEIKALRFQLVQEQARVHEANQRIQALHQSMDEKSKALNESNHQNERMKNLIEELTKERHGQEEKLRAVRLEHDKLQQGRRCEEDKMSIQVTALQQQLQNSQRIHIEHDQLIQRLSQERENLQAEIENIQKQASETSSLIRSSQSQCTELQQERDAFIKKIKTLEDNLIRLQKTDEDLKTAKLSLQTELNLKKQLQEENERLRNEFGIWKKNHQNQDEQMQKNITVRLALETECTSLKSRIERLQAHFKEVEERHKLQLQRLEQERNDLGTLRDSMQEEIVRVKQKATAVNRYTQTDYPEVDPSTLVFDGVRKKVTAQQLHDCGVLDKKTLDHLLKGHQTVQDVSVDIKLNLKGTGAIAGLVGPTGKLTITEAKKDKLISAECALKLLEAQAATGHILDPRANLRLTVEEACLNGLVDEADKKQLLTAEAACVGFRDSNTAKLLSSSQAIKKGQIDEETALRLLQAQEAAGGILDPLLSVYLPKDIARDRNVIDENLYQALNTKPNCYIDPGTNLSASYVSLKKLCKADPNTGLLMLPAPQTPVTVQGLRTRVSLSHLVEANLLEPSDIDQLREGKLTSQDIEYRLRAYLQGSTCIAGVYDQADRRILPIYQAMKEGLLRRGTSLELLEAQAASGFIIDPINNQYYTVEEACKKALVGVEFKDKLLSAEKAVTGYKDPKSDKIISLFEAIERGLIEKGHGIRLLEAQIASGGIIDPKQSHRIDVDVAFKRGYFDEEMNQILKDERDDTKGFFDPNTQDNLTYLQLKSRCITDDKTGLVLLPLHDKGKTSTQKNTTRKTRVVIVDPDTNKEMTVHEAYHKGLIDSETYMELSKQESEWEEITVTASNGTSKLVISDRKSGLQYDLKELLDEGVISEDNLLEYRSGKITLTQFVDTINANSVEVTDDVSSSSASPIVPSQTVSTGSAPLPQTPSSPNTVKRIASMSITLTSPAVLTDQRNPVGAIFVTEKSEKISIYKAMKLGLVDSITAQRLLEAQACTGGIVNPENGRRISIQEARRSGIIDSEMENRLKPAQKAYIGFEDLKTKKKLSAAEAVKEKWLPFEAGQRFLEFQFLTGGLFDPEHGQRRSLDEAVRLGWLDARASHKLLDTRHHQKMLTCPKTKLRITYKEAMDACMLDDKTGVCMLPAAAASSRGISSPYNSNPSSGPGSQTGVRRGSIGSMDQNYSTSGTSRYSSFSYTSTSFSSRSLS